MCTARDTSSVAPCRNAALWRTYSTLRSMLVVLSMNVLGDGVRDLLEPRLRGRGYGAGT